MPTKPIPMRIPEDELERARAILPLLQQDPALAAAPPENVADVLRYCISISLGQLERKYAAEALRRASKALDVGTMNPCRWDTHLGPCGVNLKDVEIGAVKDEVLYSQMLVDFVDHTKWLSKTEDRDILRRAIQLKLGRKIEAGTQPWKIASEIKEHEWPEIARCIRDTWREALNWVEALDQDLDEVREVTNKAAELCEVGDWKAVQDLLSSRTDLQSKYPGCEIWWQPFLDAIEITLRVAAVQGEESGPRPVNKKGGRPRKRS